MKNLTLGILFLLALCHHKAIAQNDSNTKIIYLEILGASDVYSFNFEYLFKKNQSIQVGISWMPGTWQVKAQNDRSFFYMPIVYHYLVGSNKHKMDLSAGILYTQSNYYASPNNHKFRPEFGLGYRYSADKGFMVKTGFMFKTPLNLSMDRDQIFVYSEKKWLPWPYISMGWSF